MRSELDSPSGGMTSAWHFTDIEPHSLPSAEATQQLITPQAVAGPNTAAWHDLPPSPHQPAILASASAAPAPAPWGVPPPAGSLQQLPAPQFMAPEPDPEPTASASSYSDAGDRSVDFAFMDRHEAYGHRMEAQQAQWAHISDMHRRMEDARVTRSVFANFPTYSGDFTYSMEMEADFLEQQIRWATEALQEEQASARLEGAWSDPLDTENESPAESARLARQNDAAAPDAFAFTSEWPTARWPESRPWVSGAAAASEVANSPSASNDMPAQRVEIVGKLLPRDAQGNQYQLTSDGYVVVYQPDGDMLRIEAEQAQATGLTTQLAGAAAWALPAGGAAEALVTRGVTTLAGAAPWVPLVAVTGLLGGDTPQPLIVRLGPEMIFIQHVGQDTGQLQRLDPTTGLWEVEAARASEDGQGRFRVQVLTDAERLPPPITTPLQPQPPTGSLPLPATAERPTLLPGYATTPEQAGVISTPAAPQPSAEDLLIERRDSEELGANLRADNQFPPTDENGNELPGYRPHHMLPSNKWPELNGLRQRFEDWGIGLNDAANGVWLPSSQSPDTAPGSYHDRLHNDAYRDAFDRGFVGVETREDALERLAKVRTELQNGTFPGSRPRP